MQVQFQIDANGILSVTASELRTDIEQTIEVKPSYGLTDDEVERMLLDSFEHAEADFAARLLIEERNEAESVILATEKTMRAPEFADIARTTRARRAASASSRRWPAQGRHRRRRPRGDSPEDSRAERGDEAPGRNDDEPSVQAALTGKNIDQL